MKRKDKKKIMIIGGSVSAIILIIMLSFSIFAPENEVPDEKLPGIEEYAEETIDLAQVEDVMVTEDEVIYWNIGRPENGTDIILVTEVQVIISWSDDESAPALRPLYDNKPDTFYLTIEGIPLLTSGISNDGNETNTTTGKVASVTSTSNMGSTRATLDILNNPILVGPMEGGSNGTAWGWDPQGSTEKGNTGLYINITCVPGDIEASRPALLLYNDLGDEVTMNVKISYKTVPEEIVNSWLDQQGAFED